MQNKHNFFVSQGMGGRPTRLGQNPKFCKKLLLTAPLPFIVEWMLAVVVFVVMIVAVVEFFIGVNVVVKTVTLDVFELCSVGVVINVIVVVDVGAVVVDSVSYMRKRRVSGDNISAIFLVFPPNFRLRTRF